MLDNQQVIKKLNYLLGTLRDGEKGYREAASEVESARFKTMFNQNAQQRAQLASELEQEIRRLGGDPKEGGSAGAALHRAWMNVRDAITGKDDYAIIAEVERGEDVAIENYQDVLKEDLPGDIKSIVIAQYETVKATHDSMRDLKHAMQS
jgi:uncharacterized protein (TIGR02284 family)